MLLNIPRQRNIATIDGVSEHRLVLLRPGADLTGTPGQELLDKGDATLVPYTVVLDYDYWTLGLRGLATGTRRLRKDRTPDMQHQLCVHSLRRHQTRCCRQSFPRASSCRRRLRPSAILVRRSLA